MAKKHTTLKALLQRNKRIFNTMTVQTFHFNPIMVNTLVMHDETGEALIVDPGNCNSLEDAHLAEYIEKNNLNPAARVGNNPLVVKATGLSKNSNPIISEADADMILYANSKAHFLDNCKVTFVGHKVSSIMQLGANINVNSGATSDDDGYV